MTIKFFVTTLLTIVGLTVTACRGQVDIKNYIDSSKSMSLLVERDSTTIHNAQSENVTVQNNRVRKLIIWGQEHTEKWKRTPATYIKPNFYLSQSNDG